MYKDVLISNGSNVVDLSSIEKYMGRAIWTDLKGVEISSSYDGMISTGPKEVGTYKFVIQESPDFGKTYTTMLEVEFTIQPASLYHKVRTFVACLACYRFFFVSMIAIL